MRELDVLLLRYLDRRYPFANATERRAFERLLELPDPLIMAFVTGREAVTEPELADVIARITAHQD
ncbi:MAG TPA: succinate dehydrogenase assembly factor 2 [Steroidobacteraceae bacterium]|nr:succinate dehydrogenase assembly factor 2 [Steroidobacteraceae bacterium]